MFTALQEPIRNCRTGFHVSFTIRAIFIRPQLGLNLTVQIVIFT